MQPAVDALADYNAINDAFGLAENYEDSDKMEKLKSDYEESINKIYSERKKIYNESTFKIKCDSMKIDEIVNTIIKLNNTNLICEH